MAILIPTPYSPAKASPDSLIKIRLYLGSTIFPLLVLSVLFYHKFHFLPSPIIQNIKLKYKKKTPPDDSSEVVIYLYLKARLKVFQAPKSSVCKTRLE